MDHSREQKMIKQFGERLKEIRTAKKLSTHTLMDLADMDFGNINEIENGKINPSFTTIVLLAEALRVDAIFLLSGPGENMERLNNTIGYCDSSLLIKDVSE